MKITFFVLELSVLFFLNIHSQDKNLAEQFQSYTDSLFKTAEMNFLENKFEQAKKIFTGYLVLVPNDLRSLEYLSQVAVVQQDIYSIKYYNEKILILDPVNIDALMSLGVIYFNEGFYNKAEQSFIKVLDIESNNEEALYNLGVLYGTKGEFDKAKIILNQSIRINPQNSKIYQTLGLFYLQNQFYDEAESNLLKAISVDENLLEARKGLIILYQNQNELDLSLKYIKEIEAVSQNYPQLNLLVANQKYLEGETDSAITYALKEIQEEPDQAEAYYFLSTLYNLSGEEVKSQNAYAKAEKLFNKKNSKQLHETIINQKSLIDSIYK